MSRLDQLRILRKRVDDEIDAEEAKARRRPGLVPHAVPDDDELVPEIGAPAPEIRDWARRVGLPVPATGRLPTEIREAHSRAAGYRRRSLSLAHLFADV